MSMKWFNSQFRTITATGLPQWGRKCMNYQFPVAKVDCFRDDQLYRQFVERKLTVESRNDIERFSTRCSNELDALARQCENEKPILVDESTLELSDAWLEQKRVAAEEGLVAIGYEEGNNSRLHQFAKLFLYFPSSGLFGCPLAMTDGALACLLPFKSDGNSRITETISRLQSRDPDLFWTSGQWMTEKRGGSDVFRATQTIAVPFNDAKDYKLYGYKHFSSAIDANVAMVLAKIIESDEEESALDKIAPTLFLANVRDGDELNGVKMLRLKDKFGTRQLPTAELLLDGMEAMQLSPKGKGIAAVSRMLQITRLYSITSSAANHRRAFLLAEDFAAKRVAFGRRLSELPLHRALLDQLDCLSGGFMLTSLHLASLLDKSENEGCEKSTRLLRVLQPIMKAFICKEVTRSFPDLMEAFGGEGFQEDSASGISILYRDAQVNSIWEGTTNIQCLDVMRAIQHDAGVLDIFEDAIRTFINGQLSEDFSMEKKLLEDGLIRVAELCDMMQKRLENGASAEVILYDFTFLLARLYSSAFLCHAADTQGALHSSKSHHCCSLCGNIAMSTLLVDYDVVGEQVVRSHWKQVEAAKRDREVLYGDELETVLEYVKQILRLVSQNEKLLHVIDEINLLEIHLVWCLEQEDEKGTIAEHLSNLFSSVFEMQQPRVVFSPSILPFLLTVAHYLRYHDELPALIHSIFNAVSLDPQHLSTLLHNDYENSSLCKLVLKRYKISFTGLLNMLLRWLHSVNTSKRQHARDSVLIFFACCPMELHSETDEICGVISSGLGGIYSSMPHRLDISNNGWYRLVPTDYSNIESVQNFLDYLIYIDRLLDVSNDKIRKKLCLMIEFGFLSSVIGPCLVNFTKPKEETVTAMAYTRLMLETIKTDVFILTTSRFLLLGECWGQRVLECLVHYMISKSTQSVLLSLSLFSTLLNLNCTDVLYVLTADLVDTLLPPHPTHLEMADAELFVDLLTRDSIDFDEQIAYIWKLRKALPLGYNSPFRSVGEAETHDGKDGEAVGHSPSIDEEANEIEMEFKALSVNLVGDEKDLSVADLEDELDRFLQTESERERLRTLSDESRRSESLRPRNVEISTKVSSCGFVQSLLVLLDRLFDNSLYINLLLTQVLLQIMVNPFSPATIVLLCPRVTVQPSSKTLYQVLLNLKAKFDHMHFYDDFGSLLVKAENFLLGKPQPVQKQSLMDKLRSKPKPAAALVTDTLKNAAFSCIVFNEFCQEVAAVLLTLTDECLGDLK